MDGGSSTFTDGGSSTFTDGGSYLDGPTIDSTSYLNSGGAEGYLHVHNGEGINHAPVMDHVNHFDHRLSGGVPGASNGFLAHLLGLDQNLPNAGTHPTPSRRGFWGSTFQTLKFADLTQGMQISPAFGMLLVFLSFIGWLFVVYFIRHHEPMADQVLGKAPPADSVYADRNLMNQVRHAMPFANFSSATVYEPLPDGQRSTVEAVKHPPLHQTRYTPSRFRDLSPYAPPSGNAYPPDQNPLPDAALTAQLNPPVQLSNTPPVPFSANGFAADGYAVGAMQTPTGTKLKLFVNH